MQKGILTQIQLTSQYVCGRSHSSLLIIIGYESGNLSTLPTQCPTTTKIWMVLHTLFIKIVVLAIVAKQLLNFGKNSNMGQTTFSCYNTGYKRTRPDKNTSQIVVAESVAQYLATS